MTWGKIGDEIITHPKRLAVSLAAFGLWCGSICYASKHLTDGYVPPLAVALLAPGEPTQLVEQLRAELLAARLWDQAPDGGVVVHDYTDWNTSREEVERQKAAAKARKDKHRAKRGRKTLGATPPMAAPRGNAFPPMPGTRSTSVPDPVPSPTPERVPSASRSDLRSDPRPDLGEEKREPAHALAGTRGETAQTDRSPEAKPGDPPAELVAAVLEQLHAEPSLAHIARPGLSRTLAREGAKRGHDSAAICAAIAEAAGKEAARGPGEGRNPAELAEFVLGCVRLGPLARGTATGTRAVDEEGTRSTLALWCETYAGSTRRYGEYAVCRGDDRVAGDVCAAARAEVARHNERTGEDWGVEAVLQHQFTRYLADGDQLLVDERHPLARFGRLRSRYGFPWGRPKASASSVESSATETETRRTAVQQRLADPATKEALAGVLGRLPGPARAVPTAAPTLPEAALAATA